jgi:hypothetical protein
MAACFPHALPPSSCNLLIRHRLEPIANQIAQMYECTILNEPGVEAPAIWMFY